MNKENPLIVDIQTDETVLLDHFNGELWNNGICTSGDSNPPITLVLGQLRIIMTEEQEAALRYYYENT